MTWNGDGVEMELGVYLELGNKVLPLPQGFKTSQECYNSCYDKIFKDFENIERCVDDACGTSSVRMSSRTTSRGHVSLSLDAAKLEYCFLRRNSSFVKKGLSSLA